MFAPKILISGAYNAFTQEGFDTCGTYMASGLYKSNKFILPIYIGSAKSVEKRITKDSGHTKDLGKKKHQNPVFQNAWTAHNEKEGFVWFLLEESTLENQYVIEQKWLDFYRPFADELGGFNICHIAIKPPDATGKSYPKSEETKEKLRRANLGKKCPESTKQKLREYHKKKKRGIPT